MPDSFAHMRNGVNALAIAKYTPRNKDAFILGCHGPDPLFAYQMYDPRRKLNLADLGKRMHSEKTGLFLQNLFRYAQTNAQKDFCLGFLCHYALDSIMHPYINYITTAYGHPFNREHGHAWFESSLDSWLSDKEVESLAANPVYYFPEIQKMYSDQIITLFKQATEATYTDIKLERKEYQTAFNDFKKVKNWLYSPMENKHIFAPVIEKLLGLEKGYISSRLQPCRKEFFDIDVWRNNPVGFFRIDTIEELLDMADNVGADYIKIGLDYFHGITSLSDLKEDIGCKSYETGLALYI